MRTETLTTSVLVVDDHRLVRKALRSLLSNQEDIEVVGEAEDGAQAVELAQKLTPDVLILDVSLPKLNGLEVLQKLTGWPTAPAVVMCSMHKQLLHVALAAGASSFVDKRLAASTLVEAIRTAARTAKALRPER